MCDSFSKDFEILKSLKVASIKKKNYALITSINISGLKEKVFLFVSVFWELSTNEDEDISSIKMEISHCWKLA